MPYSNLQPVRLQPSFMLPCIRDVFVYANVKQPCSFEVFAERLDTAFEDITRIEKIAAGSSAQITAFMSSPLFKQDLKVVNSVDAYFAKLDTQYVSFASATFPKYTLNVYSGMIFAHLSTHDWQEVIETLKNKFPDLREVWEKEITCVSLQVLGLIKRAEVYYRRAAYLASSRIIIDDLAGGDLTQLQVLRARHESLANRYQSHLSETAPFLDSVDGTGTATGVTNVFH